MKLNKLYNALVIGGGVLATGCAGNSQTGTTEGPTPTNKPISTPTAKSAVAPVATETKRSSDKAEKIPLLKPKSENSKCDECEGEGRGMVCPDPNVGGTNCCWLMSSPAHPCCP